jgi:hypothetical protein
MNVASRSMLNSIRLRYKSKGASNCGIRVLSKTENTLAQHNNQIDLEQKQLPSYPSIKPTKDMNRTSGTTRVESATLQEVDISLSINAPIGTC